DATRAAQLAAGQLPFYEPGLAELLRETLASGNLRFTINPRRGLTGGAWAFRLSAPRPAPVGTPALARRPPPPGPPPPTLPARYLRAGTVVVNKSPVPVGPADWVRTLLEEALPRNAAPAFHVVSNPEFLREGSAIEDFLYPDRIVLGGDAEGVGSVAALYVPV